MSPAAILHDWQNTVVDPSEQESEYPSAYTPCPLVASDTSKQEIETRSIEAGIANQALSPMDIRKVKIKAEDGPSQDQHLRFSFQDDLETFTTLETGPALSCVNCRRDMSTCQREEQEADECVDPRDGSPAYVLSSPEKTAWIPSWAASPELRRPRAIPCGDISPGAHRKGDQHPGRTVEASIKPEYQSIPWEEFVVLSLRQAAIQQNEALGSLNSNPTPEEKPAKVTGPDKEDDASSARKRGLRNTESDAASQIQTGGHGNVKKPRLLSGQDGFSCPFRARNPGRFNVRQYTVCATQPYPNLSMLKRHIKQFHRRSQIHNCPRCRKSFSREHDLSAHLNLPADQLCEKGVLASVCDPEDGVTDDIIFILVRRKNQVKIDNWNALWKLLFPGDKQVPPPDFVPPVDIKETESSLVAMVTSLSITLLKECGPEDLEHFVEQLQRGLPSVLSEVQRRVGSSQGSSRPRTASNNSAFLEKDVRSSREETPTTQLAGSKTSGAFSAAAHSWEDNALKTSFDFGSLDWPEDVADLLELDSVEGSTDLEKSHNLDLNDQHMQNGGVYTFQM